MTGFSEEPRATYSARMDKAAFLYWNRERPGPRCELKDGEIVMHPGVSRNHQRITARFAHLLATQIGFDDWDIATGDFAVEVGEDIRYPDIMVERRATDDQAYTTLRPVVLVEILSPSSAGRDLRTKVGEYLGLASLDMYIVVSQDEAIVWVWQRDAATRAFPAEPVEIAGHEHAIAIDALGISLPLADIYRGIGAA